MFFEDRLPRTPADTDSFFARVFARHVLMHVFDLDGMRRQRPTCTDEHAEFYAGLAASYGRRALKQQERNEQHRVEVERAFTTVRVLIGDVR